MADIEINTHGPLFDGRAVAALRRYGEDLREDIAQEAIDLIHGWLGLHMKHPTGRYEAAIHIDRQRNDFVVTDWPVVYGPWLEGVGSRNFPVTRFRGYHAFRIATQDLKRSYVPYRADILLRTGGYLEEMNDLWASGLSRRSTVCGSQTSTRAWSSRPGPPQWNSS